MNGNCMKSMWGLTEGKPKWAKRTEQNDCYSLAYTYFCFCQFLFILYSYSIQQWQRLFPPFPQLAHVLYLFYEVLSMPSSPMEPVHKYRIFGHHLWRNCKGKIRSGFLRDYKLIYHIIFVFKRNNDSSMIKSVNTY